MAEAPAWNRESELEMNAPPAMYHGTGQGTESGGPTRAGCAVPAGQVGGGRREVGRAVGLSVAPGEEGVVRW